MSKEEYKNWEEGKPNLRRGVEFVTPNNEYYRNKNLGFGWAIKHENETEIMWGEK